MKKRMIVLGAIMAVVVAAFSSCEKSEDLNVKAIEGIYIGNFSVLSALKKESPDSNEGDHGRAVVSLMGNNQIEVHCFGEVIDTTFMLDYYEHNDSVMVCLTGDDFEHMYGHSLGGGHMGGGHMGGGMMNDIQNGETQWGHHMHDEHEDGDEHFGGFDLHEKTFSYAFKMTDETSPYYLRFHGTKQ